MENETYVLEGQIFEWDRRKNLINVQKHGITFKNATRAFFDPEAQTHADESHSTDENRFILLGMDTVERILTICHCFRGKDDDIIRIISARRADKQEQAQYIGG